MCQLQLKLKFKKKICQTKNYIYPIELKHLFFLLYFLNKTKKKYLPYKPNRVNETKIVIIFVVVVYYCCMCVFLLCICFVVIIKYYCFCCCCVCMTIIYGIDFHFIFHLLIIFKCIPD